MCDKIVEFNQYCKFKLKLIGKNNQLEIISIYRPPKSGNDARLCEIIDAASDKCIVVGDFNFPGIDWLNKKVNGKGNGFLQTFENNQMDQLVDFPTHIRCNTLDLVLSNTDNVTCVEDIGRLGKSDHSMLLIDTEFNAAVKETTQLTPNWRKANVADIKHEIASVDWQTAQLSTLRMPGNFSKRLLTKSQVHMFQCQCLLYNIIKVCTTK